MRRGMNEVKYSRSHYSSCVLRSMRPPDAKNPR
jgi:hypothetical protein